jgi:hypothetical protein
MPKPAPKTTVNWYADYRVRYDAGNSVLGTWQRCDRDDEWMPWKHVSYDDVPSDIWKNGRRDGWQFYTTRTHGTDNGKYFDNRTSKTT